MAFPLPRFVQERVPSFTSNRLIVYGGASTALAASVLLQAAHTRTNFYAAAVMISRSSASVLILSNFAFFLSLCVGIVLQMVFFGPLRPIELEHLYDRSWYFLTESLLALTMFRDDFDPLFVMMFGLLLFLKCFHWIAADRVEWMDQVDGGPPLSFHIRMTALFVSLTFCDTVLFIVACIPIMLHGVGGMVLFVSEFGILNIQRSSIVAKYAINLWDQRRTHGRPDAPAWEAKSMIVFYVEMITDFLKLLTYLAFFVVILTSYGLPFNILRDVYITLRSFILRCRDLIRYRAATKNMDTRYPDVTAEELEGMGDRMCIICREEMVHRDRADVAASDGPNDTPKRLSCGHVFHFHCLRSWLEHQQSCPTCRRSVLEPAAPRIGVPGAVLLPPMGGAGAIPGQPAGLGLQPPPRLDAPWIPVANGAAPQQQQQPQAQGIWGAPPAPGAGFNLEVGFPGARWGINVNFGDRRFPQPQPQQGPLTPTQQPLTPGGGQVHGIFPNMPPAPQQPVNPANVPALASPLPSPGVIQPSAPLPAATPVPPVLAAPTPTPTTMLPPPRATSPISVSLDEEDDDDDDIIISSSGSALTPREVAAQAALRRARITTPPSSQTTLPQLSPPSSVPQLDMTAPTPLPTIKPPALPTAAAGPSSAPTEQFGPPQLSSIPLNPFAHMQRMLPSLTPLYPSSMPYPIAPSSYPQPHQPLQLPPVLTEEQLEKLSEDTREGIEARLRAVEELDKVLEGVGGELRRIRDKVALKDLKGKGKAKED